jgi:fermentation-respiration switch protein FrsA (DUF1100 family)
MVLEADYATFEKAVENRVTMRLGPVGRFLAPLLTWQIKPRLGFDPEILQPAKHISRLRMPLLLIAGDADKHATLDEARLLYDRASRPTDLWILSGAKHVDFHRHAPDEYERRVLEFLRSNLKH